MKMKVPTLEVKEVLADEYLTYWKAILEHMQVLCDQQIQTDCMLAELNTHYVAMENSIDPNKLVHAYTEFQESKANQIINDLSKGKNFGRISKEIRKLAHPVYPAPYIKRNPDVKRVIDQMEGNR